MIKFLIVAVIIVVLFALAMSAWKRFVRKPDPIISLVYLLKSPRPLSKRTMEDIVAGALGITFSSRDDEATTFLVEMPGPPSDEITAARAKMFMLRLEDRMFGINNSATPYVNDKESFAASVPDGRLQRALREHTAWLSIDLISGFQTEAEKQAAYRTIASIMAGLAGDDCLAIYCPELGRCNEYDESLLETLRSETPLELFEHTTFAAVLNVDGEDPRMKAAVEEARTRWPEFAAAFHANTNPEAPFILKAKFEENGNAEFMWVSVTGIDGDRVFGKLENTPNELKNVRAGDDVEVTRSDVNDWLYLKGEEPVGGFTQKVIAERYGK